MQSVSSRIWTRVVVSISNDDNHYTTNTSSNNNDHLLSIIDSIDFSSYKYMVSSNFLFNIDNLLLHILN